MVTINGIRIHKVINIQMSITGDKEHRGPHIRVAFWHDDRLQPMNDESLLLDQFHVVKHLTNKKDDLNYAEIILPIETEIHFNTA